MFKTVTYYLQKNISIFLLISFLFLALKSSSQSDSNSITNAFIQKNVSTKALNYLDKKYTSATNNIQSQTEKLLEKIQEKENVIRDKVFLIDSSKAFLLFSTSQEVYQHFADELKQTSGKISGNVIKEYIPNIDSLQTILQFLDNVNFPFSNVQLDKITQLKDQAEAIQGKLQIANEVQDYIREREQILKSQLAIFDLGKNLLGYNKEIYYYQEKLQGYVEILNDKKKLEEKIFSTIRELPAFKKFFAENSLFSQLFNMPGSGSELAFVNTGGLQSRYQVASILSQRLGVAMTSNPEQYFQQQIQSNGAQPQLSELKEKLNSLQGSNSDMTMPDFKPDGQKSKTFLKRIEYGFSFQTTGTVYFLPVTSDIAFHIGYKFSDKAVAGFGAGYKLGLGDGLNHIKFSNQGMSIRSYADIKTKWNFWFSGGFEYNYFNAFNNLEELKNPDIWQKSALIGITKKYKIGGKKEGKIQLLYDFLAAKQVPRLTALKFRLGYNL